MEVATRQRESSLGFGAAGSRHILPPLVERAFALVWLTFLGYLVADLLRTSPSPFRLGIALAATGLIVAFYCSLVLPDPFGGPASARRFRVHVASLAALCCLVTFMSLAYGAIWVRAFVYVSTTSGLRLPARRAVWVVMGVTLLTVGVGWATSVGPGVAGLALLIGLLGLAQVGLVRVAETVRELRAARAEIARLAAGEERLRLARDLHDSVKQQVFAAGMQVAAATTLLERDPSGARTHLGVADTLIRQAGDELANVIHEMRTDALESEGLVEALREHVGKWSRQTGISTEMHVSAARSMPHETEHALFRVAQEALANVSKHSGATRACVSVEWGDDTVTLRVTDDGRGFAPVRTHGGGYGLSSMRERAQALGGSVAVESRPGGGTRVTCVCPLMDVR